MYPITEEEIQEEFSEITKIPAQKYDKFSELKYNDIKDNEEILNEIAEEAYKRRALAWMLDQGDEDFDEYLKSYKRFVQEQLKNDNIALSYKVTRNMENNESNVAKDILRGFMQTMYDAAKKKYFPYYKRHIDEIFGTKVEIKSRPKVLEHAPEDVPTGLIYDGLRSKKSFWMPESIQRKLVVLGRAVDSTVFMFMSSAATKIITDFFLKLEEDARIVAKDVLEKIKDKARRR